MNEMIGLSAKDEFLRDYHHLYNNWRIITESWLCGPASKDLEGKKFDGAYPSGFLNNIKTAFSNYYPANLRKDVLHVCAGRVPKDEGMTLDISDKFKPDYLCDAETMILPSGSKVGDELFQWCLSDWPYNDDAAKKYYKVKLLNKHKAFHQMHRVTKIGGFIGVLDEAMLQGTLTNLKVVALIGVRSVPNLDFRTFTVYKKIGPYVGKFKHAESNQKLENWN